MTSAFGIIRNGRLVDARRRLAEPADILIKGDTILSVGPPGLDAPEDATLIDASDRALMPGLVNAHVHGHGTLAKGLVGDRWPLELFLNAMPGMAGNRTIEDKYLNGLVAAVEMIRKGCTACYDLFFEFPVPSLEGVNALGRAYRDAGLRAVIAPMLADKTLYQAYPGLIDAMPEALRDDVRAFSLRRTKPPPMRSKRSTPIGRSIAIGSGRRSRLPFRFIAATHFSSVATILPALRVCLCRRISPRPRRRRCSDCGNTERR